MFQPVGGMGRIGEAFAKQVGDLITYNAKVTRIAQDSGAVTVTYEDKTSGSVRQASADWCVCTIPLSILSQIEISVGAPMQAAINAVPYARRSRSACSSSAASGKRTSRSSGASATPTCRSARSPIRARISTRRARACCSAATPGTGRIPTSSRPWRRRRAGQARRRLRRADPSAICQEFENGIAVAWHRSPFTLGCAGDWTDAAREEHYDNLCQIDGRIVLAGEHASYIPAWQEGASCRRSTRSAGCTSAFWHHRDSDGPHFNFWPNASRLRRCDDAPRRPAFSWHRLRATRVRCRNAAI